MEKRLIYIMVLGGLILPLLLGCATKKEAQINEIEAWDEYWSLELDKGNIISELKKTQGKMIFQVSIANSELESEGTIEWSIFTGNNMVKVYPVQYVLKNGVRQYDLASQGIELTATVTENTLQFHANLPKGIHTTRNYIVFDNSGYGIRRYHITHLYGGNGSKLNPLRYEVPYEVIEDMKYDILYIEGKRYRLVDTNGTITLQKLKDSGVDLLSKDSDLVK